MLDWVSCLVSCCIFFFFKQKTAYEMRISDWSSDVCSSDLCRCGTAQGHVLAAFVHLLLRARHAHLALLLLLRAQLDAAEQAHRQIGRASCRERVCQYV